MIFSANQSLPSEDSEFRSKNELLPIQNLSTMRVFVGFVSKDAVKQLEEAGAKAEIESFGNMSNFFEIRHCGTMFE